MARDWLQLTQLQKTVIASSNPRLKRLPCADGASLGSRNRHRLSSYISTHGFRRPLGHDAHIYRIASNINHACRTCANCEWSIQGTEMHITTLQAIGQNEQLFIRYTADDNLPFSCALCGEKALLLKTASEFPRNLGPNLKSIAERLMQKVGLAKPGSVSRPQAGLDLELE